MNQNIPEGNISLALPAYLAIFERFLMALQACCFGRSCRTALAPAGEDCDAWLARGQMAQMALVVLRQHDTTEVNFALRLSWLPLPLVEAAYKARDAGELVTGLPEPEAAALRAILHPVTPSGKRRLVFGVDTLAEPTKRGCLSGGGRTLRG